MREVIQKEREKLELKYSGRLIDVDTHTPIGIQEWETPKEPQREGWVACKSVWYFPYTAINWTVAYCLQFPYFCGFNLFWWDLICGIGLNFSKLICKRVAYMCNQTHYTLIGLRILK